MVVTRIGPVSCAKIAGTLYAVVGLVFGAVVACIALVGSAAFLPPGAEEGFDGFGVAAIVVLPLLYGAFGFVGTLVMAWLYNVLASMVGGIEIHLQ